jgi:hypothetical protein
MHAPEDGRNEHALALVFLEGLDEALCDVGDGKPAVNSGAVEGPALRGNPDGTVVGCGEREVVFPVCGWIVLTVL